MGIRIFLSPVAMLARSAFAAVLSSILFSMIWGAVIAFNRGAPSGLLIDAFLIFVFVFPLVLVLVFPILVILRRLTLWARSPIGPISVFAVVLASFFFVVAYLSTTTNADTGDSRHMFWAYEVGNTIQLGGITLLIALVGALCGALYWHTTRSWQSPRGSGLNFKPHTP